MPCAPVPVVVIVLSRFVAEAVPPAVVVLLTYMPWLPVPLVVSVPALFSTSALPLAPELAA
ncbi:hypothetical protein CUZ56_03032 [Saezia sanguinis]|uniref:Uncharacterized protein n=1 Tax=Saezia sanguinis TaxID=1965230 RepID=A0A433S9F9_9BURK|nr:hypothetical protein CUZ56_03032 [Saezia sanguinis]